ncbi:autotransporter domain-containing protein [Fusobacterium sp.]|uniref:autotransporter outer membrane beta-barrel domain-containing protein n=1 Tax=Fusobacterium sp. TaxID=68766 RepID=UPI00260E78E1|nr:autotransporter domain-containing protein [Fusobacterium sp.]
MKNKYLVFALIAMCGKSYATEYPIYYQKPATIEKSAYEDLLRVVDEINRKNGKNTNYLQGGIKELGPKEEGVDIVPIAHLNEKPEIGGKEGFTNKESYHSVVDIVEKGVNAFDKETKDSLAMVRRTDNKRFYFGNGNTVKDIIFQKEDKFKKTSEEIKNNKNEKYTVEGTYKRVENSNTDVNPLNISMEDYKTKIEGKSREEVAKYLQKKLKEERGIETELKNGELYTKNGKDEWKVLWDLQGVRIRDGVTEDIKYREDVLTNIYTYKPTENGDIIYTNDSSIYIEGKGSDEEKIRVNDNSLTNGKPLENYKPENGNWSKPIEKYLYDKEKVNKKEMTQEEFDKKWKVSEERIKSYSEAKEKAKNKMNNLEKENKKAIANLETLKKNPEMPKDCDKVYIKDGWGDSATIKKNEDYINSLDEKEKKLVEEYYEAKVKEHNTSKDWDKAVDNYYYGIKTEYKDIADFIIADKDIFIEKESKRIELRGKGRIEGTVDMGSGFNKIRITEELTGKYGTNITLGAYAKLKNIDIIEVGKGGGSDPNSPSLSGNHSLTLDIDKNIKNEKGHLIQHAFKDSDRDIRFVNASGQTNESKNDFEIEMMVSKLDKNSTINMGRELETEVKNLDPSGKDEYVKSKITIASDSIAHEIIDNGRKDGKNSLIEVVVKDKIKGLTSLENEAYKSIKDANKVGSIWETTSSTTKKTVFEGIREEESLKELKMLTDQMTEKNIYKHMNKIVKNEIDVYKNLSFENEIDKDKEYFVKGGYISNRDVEDNFKGNINSAYAIYEKRINEKINLGGIFGVGNSDHQEVKEDSMELVTTDSKIKGQSFYLGGYGKYNFNNNLDFVSGIGVQYGRYETDRKLKNHYQDLSFKSKTDIGGINLYSGVVYNHSLSNDMRLKVKGILSYSLISQDEINEDRDDLALNIDSQNYNYLDSEIGFTIGKTLYSKDRVSELSAGLTGIYGITGYDNEDMRGRIQGSKSDFTILGKDNQKDAIRLDLIYDVKKDSGLTYGIEGNYLTNNERTNITIGLKAGYTF